MSRTRILYTVKICYDDRLGDLMGDTALSSLQVDLMTLGPEDMRDLNPKVHDLVNRNLVRAFPYHYVRCSGVRYVQCGSLFDDQLTIEIEVDDVDHSDLDKALSYIKLKYPEKAPTYAEILEYIKKYI